MSSPPAGPERTGHCRPPAWSRFKKGQSGNPQGRPRKRTAQLPYEAVLTRKVTIQDGGRPRRVTVAEAFLLIERQRALKGDAKAAEMTRVAIERARLAPAGGELPTPLVVHQAVALGRVNSALLPLRMAYKAGRYRLDAQILLEPWLVEAALKRFGKKRLTPSEQQQVVDATRTPHKVTWPPWWEIKPWL
jgi:hypothetical protein